MQSELERMKKKEQELSNMEKTESELIKKLQNTQQNQKTAFGELESAIKYQSPGKGTRSPGGSSSKEVKAEPATFSDTSKTEKGKTETGKTEIAKTEAKAEVAKAEAAKP